MIFATLSSTRARAAIAGAAPAALPLPAQDIAEFAQALADEAYVAVPAEGAGPAHVPAVAPAAPAVAHPGVPAQHQADPAQQAADPAHRQANRRPFLRAPRRPQRLCRQVSPGTLPISTSNTPTAHSMLRWHAFPSLRVFAIRRTWSWLSSIAGCRSRRAVTQQPSARLTLSWQTPKHHRRKDR